MSIGLPIIGKVVEGISGYLGKREERKQAKESAEAKIKMAQVDGDYKVTFTDQEWEAVSKRNEESTWKDEYLTIIMTAPLIVVFASAFLTGMSGKQDYLESAKAAVTELVTLLPNYSELVFWVVLAGIGIKATRVMK